MSPEHVYEAELQRTPFGWTFFLILDGEVLPRTSPLTFASREAALAAAYEEAIQHREDMQEPSRVVLDLDSYVPPTDEVLDG